MSNKIKREALSMPFGTAQNRLRKAIMFQMIQKLGLDICFQCGKKIETIEELSIEHKISWLYSNNPKELFFDLDNIAFSHLKCNSLAADRAKPGLKKHPSCASYDRGCRCTACTELKRIGMVEYRKKKKAEDPMYRRK